MACHNNFVFSQQPIVYGLFISKTRMLPTNDILCSLSVYIQDIGKGCYKTIFFILKNAWQYTPGTH